MTVLLVKVTVKICTEVFPKCCLHVTWGYCDNLGAYWIQRFGDGRYIAAAYEGVEPTILLSTSMTDHKASHCRDQRSSFGLRDTRLLRQIFILQKVSVAYMAI